MNTSPILSGLTQTPRSQEKEYFNKMLTFDQAKEFTTSAYSNEPNVNKQILQHQYDGPYKTK